MKTEHDIYIEWCKNSDIPEKIQHEFLQPLMGTLNFRWYVVSVRLSELIEAAIPQWIKKIMGYIAN